MEKSMSACIARAHEEPWTLGSIEIGCAAQVLSGFVAGFAAFPLWSAIAQVGESGHSLSLALAVKAATEAIAACASNGYPVSVVVIDSCGIIKLEAKGDHSTVHSTTSAYRNVYTVVTFGPIFRFDASSTFAMLLAKNPNGSALATLPDTAPLAGWSRSKSSLRSVPRCSAGCDKDEACAQAGVASIKYDLASSQ
jgi:uncharacterized protein GlcG (DUF336 family)